MGWDAMKKESGRRTALHPNRTIPAPPKPALAPLCLRVHLPSLAPLRIRAHLPALAPLRIRVRLPEELPARQACPWPGAEPSRAQALGGARGLPEPVSARGSRLPLPVPPVEIHQISCCCGGGRARCCRLAPQPIHPPTHPIPARRCRRRRKARHRKRRRVAPAAARMACNEPSDRRVVWPSACWRYGIGDSDCECLCAYKHVLLQTNAGKHLTIPTIHTIMYKGIQIQTSTYCTCRP